ncbi:MAG: hypothetical protein ACREJC_14340 [Tepidisphaeraceae bacterium]
MIKKFGVGKAPAPEEHASGSIGNDSSGRHRLETDGRGDVPAPQGVTIIELCQIEVNGIRVEPRADWRNGTRGYHARQSGCLHRLRKL